MQRLFRLLEKVVISEPSEPSEISKTGTTVMDAFKTYQTNTVFVTVQ